MNSENNNSNIFDTLQEEIMQSDLPEEEKNRRLSMLLKVSNHHVNLMLVSATGAGKSSTINALFDMSVAKVGVGVDPETKAIVKYDLGKDNTKYDDSNRADKTNLSAAESGINTGKSVSGNKKASEKQIKLINDIITDISKGYETVGQIAPPEAIIKRMKETLKINKDVTEFLVSEASSAIDYLNKIKVQIPKPDKAS